jgi:transposase
VEFPGDSGHLTAVDYGRSEVYMNKKRRAFTREFKAEAVRLVHSGRGTAEVAREIGVRPDTLRNWVLQAEGRAGMRADGAASGGGTRTEQEEEIRKLRREVEMLKDERDFLKKAAAYFASGPR